MGKFRTSEFHHVEGIYAPVESVVDYTYCDKCGSFNIDIGYPKRAFDDPLAIVILLSYVGAIVAGFWTRSLTICLGIGTMGLVAFVIFSWGKHSKCRECGNENITSENVLNYPNAKMKIDVPENSIVKDFIETRID